MECLEIKWFRNSKTIKWMEIFTASIVYGHNVQKSADVVIVKQLVKSMWMFLLTDDDLLQRYLAKSEKLREHENTNYNLSLLVNKMKIVQKWRQQSLMTRVQHSVLIIDIRHCLKSENMYEKKFIKSMWWNYSVKVHINENWTNQNSII